MRSDNSLKPQVRQTRAWSPGRQNDIDMLNSELPLGFSFSGHERDRLFLSDRGRQFTDVSGISGLDSIADGRTAVMLDYDHDGWQDIVMINSNAPLCEVFHNEIPSRAGFDPSAGRFLALRLVGGNLGPEALDTYSPRDGYGALLTFDLGDCRLLREHRCGEGRAGQSSRTMHLGLGTHDRVVGLTVRWPSGRVQTWTDVAAGQLVTLYENPDEAPDGSGLDRQPYGPAVGPVDPSSPGSATNRLTLAAVGEAADPTAPQLRVYTTTATWCPACKRSLPQLRVLRETFPAEQLAMFGVPIDPEDQPQALRDYAEKQQPGYQLLAELSPADREAVQRQVRKALATEALPSTVITDGAGRILRTMQGVPSISDIRRLLASPAGAPAAAAAADPAKLPAAAAPGSAGGGN